MRCSRHCLLTTYIRKDLFPRKDYNLCKLRFAVLEPTSDMSIFANVNKTLGSGLKACEKGAASLERRKSTSSTRMLKQAVNLAQKGVGEMEKIRLQQQGASTDPSQVRNFPTSPSSPTSSDPQEELAKALQACGVRVAERDRAIANHDVQAEQAADRALGQSLDRAADCSDPTRFPPGERKDTEASQERLQKAASAFKDPKTSRSSKDKAVSALGTTFKTAMAFHKGMLLTGLVAGIALLAIVPATTVYAADGSAHEVGYIDNGDGTTTMLENTNSIPLYDQSTTFDTATGVQLEPTDTSMGVFDTVGALFGF